MTHFVTAARELVVRYPYKRRKVTLRPGDDPLFLDRRFLNRTDLTVSRAPDAPALLMRAGEWWLDNNCSRHQVPTVFTPDLGRRVEVPYGCSFRLREGHNDLRLWAPEYALSLTVAGVPDSAAGTPDTGPVTIVGLSDSQRRVHALFQRSPRYKLVMAAVYRDFLTPGIDRPRELSRQDAAKCVGGDPNEVSDAKKAVMQAIWGEQGHGDHLAAYLINHRFLTPSDQGLIPHRGCAHRDAAVRR
ncbi:hypothetical protein [Actinoplanes sp. NPDC051851]|uniref:hypothetical protein n=1 Tax=Actinoplanes sp. NPDC051851 TaxID=3154753 RepID=UPI00342605D5